MVMLKLFMWTPFLAFLLLSMHNKSCSSLTPVDNYLLACGSSTEIYFQGRTFLPESAYSDKDILELKTQESVAVTHYGAPSPIYQSATIFWGNASYIFRITHPGQHWIRLYFYPLPNSQQNLSSASVTVVADGVVLLKDFTFWEYGGSYLFQEHVIDITSPILALTFISSANSFAFVNAIEVVSTSDDQGIYAINNTSIMVGSIIGAVAFLVLVAVTFYYLKTYRSKARSSRASTRSCRLFTLQEISEATDNFDKGLLVGEGGFGKVYKGTMNNGKQLAIKVANPQSRQGLGEFQNEIELLSKLSHQNLVSLIGCCNEDSQMILVYEFLANGSLSGHLYGTSFIPLSWKQRLEICLGTAKGLHFLHTGAPRSIIHRDVKTANILLNGNLVPKVADFGISKKGPPLDKSHVTTLVKGSFGYLDPEYFRTKYLTEKSDVFSFGMVLMEVMCGKPALDENRPTEHLNLARWVSSCQEKGRFHEIIDPNLIGKVNLDSLNKVRELAWKCLEESRINRPPMGYVLCELEDALHIELASSPIQQVSVDCAIDMVAENGIKDEKEQ